MTSTGEEATTRRAALLKDYDKHHGLTGTLQKQRNMQEFMTKHHVLIREELAPVGLSKVDCIMLRLPYGGTPCVEMAVEMNKLRSLGIRVVLCAAGTNEEAEAAAKQDGFMGSDQADWSSSLEFEDVKKHVLLAQTPVEGIPAAIQACQEEGKFVLYFGFAEKEELAVAAAAVGFAAASASEKCKAVSSAIALGEDIAILGNSIEASRAMMAPKQCCTVQ
jgi:hypothetical protein